MGRKRGQRNAAREKAWPGAEAAKVRAVKHGVIAQTEEHPSTYAHNAHKLDLQGDAGSIPAGAANFDVPLSDIAALERKENAEDGRIGSPLHTSPRRVGRRSARWKAPKALADTPLRKLRERSPATKAKIIVRNRLTAEDLAAKRELYHLLSNLYSKSKTDFFKTLGGFNHVEYALPEMWHECDPSELLDIFSCIDWHRMALALGYREAEIRKYARA